jgi:hypothetical protein
MLKNVINKIINKNFYPLQINMTKNIIKLWAIILWIIALTVAVVVIATPKQEQVRTLWTLVDEMDALRDLKEECTNNLNIVDSAKFLKGYTWYCDSWDNEIIELRNKINELSKKDYEGLM